jgi:hypothetical protein
MMACYGGPPCDKCAVIPDANGDTGVDGGTPN